MFAASPDRSPFSTISKLSSSTIPPSSTATAPIASRRSRSGSRPEVSVSTTTQRPGTGASRPVSPPNQRRSDASPRLIPDNRPRGAAGSCGPAASPPSGCGGRGPTAAASGTTLGLVSSPPACEPAPRGDAARAGAAAARTRTRRRTHGLRSPEARASRAACCQPLDRVGRGDAGRQREDARASTKGTLPLILRSMPSTPASSSAACSSPHQLSGGRLRERVVGHLLQEPGIGLRALRDVGAQRVGEPRLAPQRPEVEEDARGEQAGGIAPVDPACERRFPLVEARAPARIHRHHAAFAQRIAAARPALR